MMLKVLVVDDSIVRDRLVALRSDLVGVDGRRWAACPRAQPQWLTGRSLS